MTGLVQLIQRIAQNVLNMDRPMEIRFGIVTKLSPLQITLGQDVSPLEGNMILHGSAPALSLEEGDRVILLQNRKGQQYYIIGKR